MTLITKDQQQKTAKNDSPKRKAPRSNRGRDVKKQQELSKTVPAVFYFENNRKGGFSSLSF